MLDLIDEILSRVALGESVALCAVVDARGSTPQARGAAMLVLANGETLGTLGGGCVEAEVRVRAVRLMQAPVVAPVMRFKLDHDYGWDDGLLCGGMMDVCVQILATAADLAPLIALREALADRRAATYAIDGLDPGGAPQRFELHFEPRPTLVIAGAGHVGQALARVAHDAAFDVTVIDDRGDYVNEQRFPDARRVIGDIERELRTCRIDPQTYVVIVTRGHRHDAQALAAVVGSDAAYIGMIGSKRKIRTIFDELARAGVPRERLLRVHAPVGFEIGAVTPQEIAVSIAAELIAVRRGRAGEPARSLKMSEEDVVRWLDRGDLRPSE